MKWISIEETAEMLSVSESTVRYYVKTFILVSHKERRGRVILKESVLLLKSKLDHNKEFRQVKKKLIESQEDLDKLQKLYDNEIMSLKSRILDLHQDNRMAKLNYHVDDKLKLFVELNEHRLDEREYKMLIGVISGDSLENLAGKFNLSIKRIRMIILKSICKLKHFPLSERTEFENKIEELEKEIVRLQFENENLREKRTIEKEKEEAMLQEINYLRKIKIEELNLSTRPLRCLNQAGIEDLSALVYKDEAHLLKLRNMGKKSILEINEALGKRGFHLGMKPLSTMQE